MSSKEMLERSLKIKEAIMNKPASLDPGSKMADRLCAIFGGQMAINSIDIHFEVGCCPTAKITHVVGEEQMEEVFKLLEDGKWSK